MWAKVNTLPALRSSGRLQFASGAPIGVLREGVAPTADVDANIDTWITPVLVFTNAFVERASPIKGVKIINKKFLSNLIRMQNKKEQNLTIWENRERIMKALCA